LSTFASAGVEGTFTPHPKPADLPLVSIIVLCRNEGDFIAGCLDSLIANDYPKDRLEVIIADGMSQDGTRDIVESYSEKHTFVRLVNNPKRIPAAAANAGIRAAKGDFIMIAGAHAHYPKTYVSKCVAYAERYPGAHNIGGVRRTEPRDNTIVGKSIAYVSLHRLGAGPAAYHRGGNSPSWVDTVWGGCFHRELFDKVGLYNEELVVGEDRELNKRVRGLGGKILLVPEITCIYYARSKFSEHCRWVFRMGFWPFYASKIVGRSLVAPKNFVPLALVASIAVSLMASCFTSDGRYLFVGILAPYILGTIASAVALVKRERDLRYLIVAPFLFGVTHMIYGLGTTFAMFKPVPPPKMQI
jgi:glycosyltransferase involved in cell wall biosynthesis